MGSVYQDPTKLSSCATINAFQEQNMSPKCEFSDRGDLFGYITEPMDPRLDFTEYANGRPLAATRSRAKQSFEHRYIQFAEER